MARLWPSRELQRSRAGALGRRSTRPCASAASWPFAATLNAAVTSSRDIEQTFTDIYRRNAWGGTESVSGTGSGLAETRALRSSLRLLIDDFEIATMLDIPCGDFHWMQHT